MATAPQYSYRSNQRNVELVRALLHASSREEFVHARDAVLDDFHPSILSILDREFASQQHGHPADWIADHIWLVSCPLTLHQRQIELGISASDLTNLDRLLAAYLEAARARPDEAAERQEIFGDALERELVSLTGLPQRDSLVLSQFENDLGGRPNGERWVCAASVAFQNLLFILLDDPRTRYVAKRTAHVIKERYGSVEKMMSLAAGRQPLAPTHLATLMLAVVSEQDDAYPNWRTLIAHITEGLIRVPRDRLNAIDGQWTMTVGPCPHCAMNYAVCAVVALDTTCTFLHDENHFPEFVYLPKGLNRCTCPFCGREFAVETPAVFYEPDRFAVIYCLPTSPETPNEADALTRYAPDIERIRTRYAHTLEAADEAAYWAAPELFTYTWEKFLDAVRRGESIYEDHPLRLVIFAAGEGQITDLTKKFRRELTETEVTEHLIQSGYWRDVHEVDGILRVDVDNVNAQAQALKDAWTVKLAGGPAGATSDSDQRTDGGHGRDF